MLIMVYCRSLAFFQAIKKALKTMFYIAIIQQPQKKVKRNDKQKIKNVNNSIFIDEKIYSVDR